MMKATEMTLCNCSALCIINLEKDFVFAVESKYVRSKAVTLGFFRKMCSRIRHTSQCVSSFTSGGI